MSTRTKDITVRFRHAFSLKGVERILPPGEYRATTEEDSIDGLSFFGLSPCVSDHRSADA